MVSVAYCNKEYFSQYQNMEMWKTVVTYKNIWIIYIQYKSICFLHWCVTVNVTVILVTVDHCFLPTNIPKMCFVSHPGSRLDLTDVVTGRNLSFLTPHDRNTSSFWSDSRSWRWWPLYFITVMFNDMIVTDFTRNWICK